jgi:hypothetical protein
MLTRILALILFFMFIRFLLRLIREVARPSVPPNPGYAPGKDDPLRGKKVIDVDYVEMKPGDEPKKGTR